MLNLGKRGYLFGKKKKTLWTPAELENLDLWFDVSRETAQSDDTEMTSLTDFSGNGRNLTAYGTTKPKYRTNLLNGLPGVKFTGSGVFWTSNWQSGNFPLIWSAVTIATMFNIRSGAANTGPLIVFNYNQLTNVIRYFNYGHNHTYSNTWAGWRNVFGFNFPGPQQPHILSGRGNPGIYISTLDDDGVTEFRENGTTVTPGLYYDGSCSTIRSDLTHLFQNTTCNSSNITSTSRFNGFSIGGALTNTSGPTFTYADANNYFYEMVYCNTELSFENQKKLEGYLAHKWGKTSSLPSGHPYKYEPPYKVEPEEIVTDGLVLNLDAGDYASYPRSGTTWYDITANGNNGTLTNGPTYDSANKGSIVFDGSNDHTLLPTNFFSYPSLTTFTISLWFRSSQTSGGTLFGQQNSNNPSSAGAYVPVVYLRSDGKIRVEPFWTGNGNNFILSSSTLNDDNWHNIVTTFNSGTNQLYVDGVYVTQQTGKTLVSYTSTYYYMIGAGYAAGRGLGTNYFSGNIANFSFYNRALSSTEIQQNFNALRGRYGI